MFRAFIKVSIFVKDSRFMAKTNGLIKLIQVIVLTSPRPAKKTSYFQGEKLFFWKKLFETDNVYSFFYTNFIIF
jgi:hypothetical protein